jgi:signal transduction histidine kinase
MVEVSLTRERRRWRLFGPEPEVVEVLARKRFHASDLSGLTTWASVLEQAAQHTRSGTLGCFVTTTPTDEGSVRICLYERVIAPTELHTTLLADRSFDASDERALVASAEFAEELRAWAKRRNAQRRSAEQAALEQEDVTAVATQERQRAARELAEILQRVDRDSR